MTEVHVNKQTRVLGAQGVLHSLLFRALTGTSHTHAENTFPGSPGKEVPSSQKYLLKWQNISLELERAILLQLRKLLPEKKINTEEKRAKRRRDRFLATSLEHLEAAVLEDNSKPQIKIKAPSSKDTIKGVRRHTVGASLVIQWLRLRAPKAGAQGSIPGRPPAEAHPELQRPGSSRALPSSASLSHLSSQDMAQASQPPQVPRPPPSRAHSSPFHLVSLGFC